MPNLSEIVKLIPALQCPTHVYNPFVEHQFYTSCCCSVSDCQERCYTTFPLEAMDEKGKWWKVIQTIWFRQRVTRCKCSPDYCYGHVSYLEKI